jgi:hypothetical protein
MTLPRRMMEEQLVFGQESHAFGLDVQLNFYR